MSKKKKNTNKVKKYRKISIVKSFTINQEVYEIPDGNYMKLA